MKIKVTIGLVLALLLAMVPASSLSSAKSDKDVVILTSSNTIVFSGAVGGDTVGKAIAQAKALDSNASALKEKVSGKAPLYLFLNTPGGEIQAGLELIEAMNGLDHKVNTITLFAASMGWQIAQNLGDRLILKSGVLMSHHAVGEFKGAFGGVSPNQMDARYQLWLDRVKELDEQTVKRTNGKQTYKSYTEQYDHEMWLTGTKAVEQGYADRVVMIKCDSSLSGTTEHQLSFLGMQISYETDNCPINTSPQNVKIGGAAGPLSADYVEHVKSEFLAQFALGQKTAISMH